MVRYKAIPVGSIFGKLTVTGEAPRRRQGGQMSSYSVTACQCGTIKEVSNHSLKTGNTRSCGCHKSYKTHGLSKMPTGKVRPEYSAWRAMIDRCTNHNNIGWSDYGARGVTVCDSWKASFPAFYADMGDRPSPRHSLDRINNGGGYDRSNCRWADKKTQASNRRSSRFIVLYGETTGITEACTKLGLSPQGTKKKARRRKMSVQEFIDLHTYQRRCEISDPYHAAQTIP